VRDAGLCAQIACIWEATARKPGNVHRYSDFEDSNYLDFLLSAAALAPVLTTACQQRIGATVLECMQAARRVAATNANLGMVLLLAPLAAVPPEQDLRGGVARVLAMLDVEDARLAYQAIRLAAPGGLGRAVEQDVRDEPTQSLQQVMALAADRDLVARQYANGFAEVFEAGVPAVLAGLERTGTMEGAIVFAHLRLLAKLPDTLIVRKRGWDEAREATQRASKVLAANWPHDREGWTALAELDAWLRAEGHSRNPGTTADLLAAALFIVLREGKIKLPCPFPWSMAGQGG
jgi:triphosphoribosyl-dephospho-CoA synthase